MFKRKIFGLVALYFLLGSICHAVESKLAWQQEWEKTLDAAKKEGRFNFYVGR